MKNDVRFEYVPWKNVRFCFISIAGFKLLIKLRNFDFEVHQNTLIFFDKKMMPDLIVSCLIWFNRSSRPEVFYKKGVLRNFAKLTGKHLCQSLFFKKSASVRPATLLLMRLWHQCFPVNFAKFLRTSFFMEHLLWLPLIEASFRILAISWEIRILNFIKIV